MTQAYTFLPLLFLNKSKWGTKDPKTKLLLGLRSNIDMVDEVDALLQKVESFSITVNDWVTKYGHVDPDQLLDAELIDVQQLRETLIPNVFVNMPALKDQMEAWNNGVFLNIPQTAQGVQTFQTLYDGLEAHIVQLQLHRRQLELKVTQQKQTFEKAFAETQKIMQVHENLTTELYPIYRDVLPKTHLNSPLRKKINTIEKIKASLLQVHLRHFGSDDVLHKSVTIQTHNAQLLADLKLKENNEKTFLQECGGILQDMLTQQPSPPITPPVTPPVTPIPILPKPQSGNQAGLSINTTTPQRSMVVLPVDSSEEEKEVGISQTTQPDSQATKRAAETQRLKEETIKKAEEARKLKDAEEVAKKVAKEVEETRKLKEAEEAAKKEQEIQENRMKMVKKIHEIFHAGCTAFVKDNILLAPDGDVTLTSLNETEAVKLKPVWDFIQFIQKNEKLAKRTRKLVNNQWLVSMAKIGEYTIDTLSKLDKDLQKKLPEDLVNLEKLTRSLVTSFFTLCLLNAGIYECLWSAMGFLKTIASPTTLPITKNSTMFPIDSYVNLGTKFVKEIRKLTDAVAEHPADAEILRGFMPDSERDTIIKTIILGKIQSALNYAELDHFKNIQPQEAKLPYSLGIHAKTWYFAKPIVDWENTSFEDEKLF